jgi:hypothetical protein
MNPTKAGLEQVFAGGFLSAEPFLRLPIPLFRAAIAECAVVALQALGLSEDASGDEELEGLLEFDRASFKPYRGYTAEQAILSVVRQPEFQALSSEGRTALTANLMKVVEEATREVR